MGAAAEVIDDGKARAEAHRKALAMLRAGKDPDTVAARLRKDGLDPRAAEEVVTGADDLLQDELDHGAKAKKGKTAAHELAVPEGLSPREKALAKGRSWMGAIAILYAASGTIFALLTENWTILAVNLALGFVHLGLWYWSKRALFPAAVTALVLFLGVHLVNAVMDPATLAQGVVVKVLFVVALVEAIRAARQAASPAEVFA
jgi:hypothetical protein